MGVGDQDSVWTLCNSLYSLRCIKFVREIFLYIFRDKAKPIARWGRKATGPKRIAGLPFNAERQPGFFMPKERRAGQYSEVR